MKLFIPLLAFLSLTACASLEHGIVDATTFENDLPPEVRRERDTPSEQLGIFVGTSAVVAFEAARRFEHGANGFPQDLICAHALYTQAGGLPFRTTTTINGVPQQENYRGLPNGRLAARRLQRDQGVMSNGSRDVERCKATMPH